ncbi:MAG: hypothetical protein NVV72_15750 [Asticcacaulis sp.]|nr:hypothetical protein [Asticcacaulis sp.]
MTWITNTSAQAGARSPATGWLNSMTIDSYAKVQASIALWLNRPDLGVYIPDFIALAENRLNRLLCDNVNLVKKTSITLSSSETCLPDDFNGMVSLIYPGPSGGALRYKPASDFFDLRTTGGPYPQYFTISAGNLCVWPGPSDAATLTMRYRTKLDALKYGPNWLLDNHPDAYVFGALVEACGYEEDPRGPLWQNKFNTIIEEINDQAQDIAFGGPLQVKSCGGE